MASDVDLLDEFVNQTRRRTTCGVAGLLTHLTEQQRDKVLAALDVDTNVINNAAIHRVLLSWDVEGVPSRNTIGTHRRGQCGCPRPSDG